VLAYCPAARANEGAVPLSVPLRVGRVVVPPDEKQQEDEDAGRNQTKERQRSRGHGCGVRRNGVDVEDDPADAEKHQKRSKQDL